MKRPFQGAQTCTNTGMPVIVNSHLVSSNYSHYIHYSALKESPRKLALMELIIISLSRHIFRKRNKHTVTITLPFLYVILVLPSWIYSHRSRSFISTWNLLPTTKWLFHPLQPIKLQRKSRFNLDDLSWMAPRWMFNYNTKVPVNIIGWISINLWKEN